MDEIAKNHAGAGDLPLMAPLLQPHRDDPLPELCARLAERLREAAAHPGRSVVLLPFMQLVPLVQRAWAGLRPDGFAPRFETTRSWSQSAAPWIPQELDIAHDAARDQLTARALLEQAGLRPQAQALAGRLVEAAHQLAPLVAALPLPQREAWRERARLAVAGGIEVPVLALDAAVARIAIEWAAASGHASDGLWQLLESEEFQPEALAVLEGWQADPWTQALRAHLGERAISLPLLQAPRSRGSIALHAARDAEDEASLAAACVLRHLEAGRLPVALVATDRALTRRVRAMLDARGIRLRDETGWTLSTTRAAAHVMGALRAAAWNAGSDAVLDWLKNCPSFAPPLVDALEAAFRRAGLRAWRPEALPAALVEAGTALHACVEQAEALRQELRAARPLAAWLGALRAVLEACGLWAPLAADAAGQRVLAALHLLPEAQAVLSQALAATAWSTRRLDASEFTAWASQSLEAANFVPEHAAGEQVTILPLGQLLARPFAALVLPGCDEIRLSAAPEPPGAWSAPQREALGLPSREALAQVQRAAWEEALRTPFADVLWRQGEGGEPLLPSAFVQELLLDGLSPLQADPRELRPLDCAPTPRPLPRAPQLGVAKLSASAYEDLRRCPYRFFALRQLGLREADELEAEVGKRDFGVWLHEVLKLFHEALAELGGADAAARLVLIDQSAEQATQALGLGEDEFLPFAAAWPQVRDGYLAWLVEHEASGARFAQAEVWAQQPLADWTLVGQIDRIDRLPDGRALLLDYKTEPSSRTRERLQQPTEDTQLPFYAALLSEDTLAAAYLNVGEREPTKAHEQPDIVALRDALVEGILTDMRRIADGAVLPALGEGAVCDYCAARGLCRKDFWA